MLIRVVLARAVVSSGGLGWLLCGFSFYYVVDLGEQGLKVLSGLPFIGAFFTLGRIPMGYLGLLLRGPLLLRTIREFHALFW